MSQESVERAVKELETAINNGEHNCDVHVEDLGDMKEVSFYLYEPADGDAEPIATLTITPGT